VQAFGSSGAPQGRSPSRGSYLASKSPAPLSTQHRHHNNIAPYRFSCLREAKRRGALTIGIANNRGTPILVEADYSIWLDTGPEPIAGSTRMKAGTAQRVTLNLLSSLVMIRLGRVHEGLMVDVQAVNAKLERRSENILRRLTGRGGEGVRDAQRGANGSVKLVVLSTVSVRDECC
jgi:N-acetylmuramic acid 6-phosphate etherase